MIDLTLYNYILINPNLTIDYCDVCSERTTTTYASNSAIVTAITQVKTDYSYLGGIIPTGSNTEYVINVAKVKYYEQQLSFLYLRFANDYELRIDCSTNALALESYNVIDCIYRALNEATIYTNRVQWYVKEGITDSVTTKSFSEIQTAVTYLQNNGLSENAQVIVRSGTYNSFAVSSSLMIKFESDVTIAGGTVIQSLSNVNTTDAIYFVQNSENSNYYSPAIYVNTNTLLYSTSTDKQITFVYADNSEVYKFLTLDTYTSAMADYLTGNYKQTVSIPDLTGNVYIFNVNNVTHYSVSTANLTVEAGNTITIACINAEQAQEHYSYLDNINTGYNIYDTFPGTRVYVSEGESIHDAVQNASSGDMVIVNTGNYTGNIRLKNGVDLFFMDNVTLQSSSNIQNGIFTDAGGQVVCNIYGFPNINLTDTICLSLFGNNSNVYFEVKDIVQASATACLFQSSQPGTLSKLQVKGRSLTRTVGGALGISDYDGAGNIQLDYDFANVSGEQSNLLYGFNDPESFATNIYILRNMQTSTDELKTIETTNLYAGSFVTHIFINTRFKNTNSSAESDFLYYSSANATEPHKAYFFNCFCVQNGKPIDAEYTITSYIYNANYSNTDKGSLVTLSGTGDLTIKPYLNLN